MITDDAIKDIAKELKKQYEYLEKTYDSASPAKLYYTIELRDVTAVMANVVHIHNPFYDLDIFYDEAGYIGTHPIHSSID